MLHQAKSSLATLLHSAGPAELIAEKLNLY